MSVRFGKFSLIYPPRASNAINPKAVNRYPGYIAQYKYNDTRTLIYIFPDGTIELYNRHKQRHTAYQLSDRMRASIEGLKMPSGFYHVFDGGLMHNKSKNIKDRIILWDILVFKSEYLIGTTYRSRYDLLRQLTGNPHEFETETSHRIALKINTNLWLAPIFTDGFPERYGALIHLDEIEGLVLKDPNGKLEWGLTEDNNGKWQIRVRKPNPNYRF